MTTHKRFRFGEFVTIALRGKSGVWTAEFRFEGEHQRRSLKTRNLKIARKRAAKIDRQLADGTFAATHNRRDLAGSDNSITSAINAYIQWCETEGCRPKTRTKYRGILEKFGAFAADKGVTKMSSVEMRLIDKFRQFRKPGLSPKSMHHDGSTLKRFCDWAAQRGYLPLNPLASTRFTPPDPKEKGVLTLDQVNTILRAASARERPILALLAFTGLRSGEVQRLLATDVDLKGNWIRVVSRPGAETKNGKSRDVPIHPRLRVILQALPVPNGRFYFTAEPSTQYPVGGHHMNAKRLNESFLRTLKTLDIPAGRVDGFTIHSLRHFMRTAAVNAGVPERAVDLWLGHEADKKAVQAVYYHMTAEQSQAFIQKVPFGDRSPAASAGTQEKNQ